MKRSAMPARRTPLRATSQLKQTGSLRRTRLAPVSDERRDEEWEWQQVKVAVDRRDRGVCRASLVDTGVRCSGRLHPHHRWPTGEGGARLDIENVLTICAGHHRWAHSVDRKKATALGLISREPGRE